MPEDLITLNEHVCYGGAMSFHEHRSETCDATMRFSVYVPPQAAERPVPVLYYLAGLTSTEETFMIKGGAQRVAAEHGLMLVAPTPAPAGSGYRGRTRTGTSVAAPDSTSTPRPSPGRATTKCTAR